LLELDIASPRREERAEQLVHQVRDFWWANSVGVIPDNEVRHAFQTLFLEGVWRKVKKSDDDYDVDVPALVAALTRFREITEGLVRAILRG
jgi:hypothetical protein